MYSPTAGEVQSWDYEYPDNAKQVTIAYLVPGCTYRFIVYASANYNYITLVDEYITVPATSTFVDGKLSASAIKTTISFRCKTAYTHDSTATSVDYFSASEIRNAYEPQNKKHYGIKYEITYPKLATTRTYNTMIVYRCPNGYCHAYGEGDEEYTAFAYSGGRKWWHIHGFGLWNRLLNDCGYIPSGTYYVDLYWDGMLVNTNSFRVY